MDSKYKISGMMCAGCVSNVERSVKKVPGISKIEVSLLTNSMEVSFKDKVNDEAVIKAVQDAGYDASIFEKQALKEIRSSRKAELKMRRIKLIISAVILVVLMYVAMAPMDGFNWPLPWSHHQYPLIGLSIQLVLALTTVGLNFGYFIRGFRSLFKLKPNMDSLTAIGATSALVYGIYALIMTAIYQNSDHALAMKYAHNVYIETSAMILVFISFGKYLEELAKARTKTSLEKLIGLVPDKALKLVGDEFVEVDIAAIVVGDFVRVNPGAKIPLDGVISEGYGDIDESAVNGEAAPKYKTVGAEVIGATTNRNGSFVFQVTRVGEDTTLQQIIKLVEKAAGSKVPLQVLADKIAGIFVPIIISLSLLVFLIWSLSGRPGSVDLAFNLAITVLVISCPCALGLATPVAVMVGTGKGAENGILVKNASSLSGLNAIDAVVFDKTGTVTSGFLTVNEVTISEDDLALLAPYIIGLERLNDHPLAGALIAYLEKSGHEGISFNDAAYIPGQGMVGQLEGEKYLVGNIKLLQDNGLEVSELNKIGTHIYVAKNNKVYGAFVLQDDIKEDAKFTIDALKEKKIKTILLTGDNRQNGLYLGNMLGIDEVYSEVLPAQKASKIKEIQANGMKVAMVGDGINDAPALEQSDVGIALGSGTQIALDSADIILVNDNPYDVVKAILLAQKVTRTIKWNLFWAFFYNVIMIPMAAGIFNFPVFDYFTLNPMIASAMMSLSSIFVVVNALLIKRLKLTNKGANHARQ